MAVKVLDQDTFTRANQSGFGTGSGGSTWATNVGTPTLSIASNEGHATNISAQAAMQLGSITSANMEGLVRCKTSATTSTRMGVALRFTASNTFYHARLSANANNLVIGKVVTGTNTDLFTTAFTTSIATFYWIRFRVVGTNLYARVWADGSGEPGTWTLTGTDSSITGAGGFGLTINASSTATTWDFDSFTVNDGTVLYDTTWRAPLSKGVTKDTTFRGVLSKSASKNTVFRGNTGHAAIKDSTWRAVLAAIASKNTAWRGGVSNVTRKDTKWRANVGHAVFKNTTFRGVLANTSTKNTAYRGNVGHSAIHDTIWRANLASISIFYASNVATTIGGLTQSDQMSTVAGGTETSVAVTMPASGTNLYAELQAQGGTSSGSSALPAPTGKGWSIPLQGNTILGGNWSSIFTLAKSGISMSGASLYVRWYRRTLDGTCYLIGSAILSSQTFSTRAIYTTPSVGAPYPWQFVNGDTLYMDAFIFNGATAWASDVFTVYVSNSATQGVYNDAIIISPQLVATPAGLSALIGASSFQTGTTIPVLNQSFTLADAIDQRSILMLTGEDAAGTLSYQRAQPVQLSDHDQGLLYTGAVNSDKASKPAAGTSNAQLEHALTFMDNHYLVDKRANTTNYLNWSAGDMVCDFVQSTLSQEGVTGTFALESDYTPTTFGQGTLSGTVATTTTSPFTYAPNTASPPITSNTGDLELTRAGAQFTLTEQTTSDFNNGLTNMVASNNELKPSTVSAFRLVAQMPVTYGKNGGPLRISGVTYPATIVNSVYAQIWSGSMTIATNDTLNYDIWISSTSPAFMAGVDFLCNDGTQLTAQVGAPLSATYSLYDQNNLDVDPLTDLSGYAKDCWCTRNIHLVNSNGIASVNLAGKTITSVSVFVTGSSVGTYTIYVKNCYLGSQSGSPFFSTTATTTNVAPPPITVAGGYIASSVTTSVVQAYLPAASYRVSPAHSVSGVGLVQNSNITWTASLPSSGTPPIAGVTTSSAGATSALLMMVSYDNATWLLCTQNQALPGLPAGANVSGLSFYLREQFQAGADPTAIPSLAQVQITINSAAAQTTSDVVAIYGNATEWNTGTLASLTLTGAGQLTTGATPPSPAWTSIVGQTLFPSEVGGRITQSASGGVYSIAIGSNPSTDGWATSRLDFVGTIADGTTQSDVLVDLTSGDPTTSIYETGILYRTIAWNTLGASYGYHAYITHYTNSGLAGLYLDYGSNNPGASNRTTLASVTMTINDNTYYTLKVVFVGNHHLVYLNGTLKLDVIDTNYTGAGGVGLRSLTNGNATLSKWRNFSAYTTISGTWTSPAISLSSLGTCGNTQVGWTELNTAGQQATTALVSASLDGGSTWRTCTNNVQIPQLTRGTNVSGKSLLLQVALYSSSFLATPLLYGLSARVCGDYGTVTGTRISPALSLSPVGYVANSNVMWNANIPTNTTLAVATTQDLSTFHAVGSSGAGEALPYWTNQPSATQDLFNTNTLANYTSTSKSGGSVASVTYTTTNSSVTLAGGSSALYLSNAITTADVDMLVDMDMSDAGGVVFRKVDANNFYEVAVYDASSSGGFTNQLRLYKVTSGTRTLLGSASSVIFTRGTVHRVRVTMQGGLINVYWDGTCKQSYLDTSPLAGGQCGLRNDEGTSRYYQLWIQPLGTNLTGQALYTKVTMTTTDPSVMPQLFTLVACVRGPSIGTGATVSQLHPITKPFSTYYHVEMDSLVQQSGDYYWYVDKWRQLHFGPRLARPGAFPVMSATDQDPANPTNVHSGYLLYQPQVSVLSSADLYRNQQIITNVNGLVTPPPEIKVADGSTTSWQMGYPLYSAPTILVNGQGATVGLQGVDNNRQFYWQPGSASISYDSSLPKLPSGTLLSFTYVGESSVNVSLNNLASQVAQAALELNSGIVAEIETALSSTTQGMTTAQATTFGNGLLSRYGNNGTIEMVGTTMYAGLAPGTIVPLFLPEMMNTWNAQLPIVKLTTTAYQSVNGIVYLYSIDATTGPSLSNWTRVFYSN